MTQRDLARKTNLTRDFIASIEIGRKEPSLSTVKSLSQALDIPPSMLMTDTPPEIEKLFRLLSTVKDVTPEQVTAIMNLARELSSETLSGSFADHAIGEAVLDSARKKGRKLLSSRQDVVREGPDRRTLGEGGMAKRVPDSPKRAQVAVQRRK